MKKLKFLSLLLAFLMVFSFVGCGKKTKDDGSSSSKENGSDTDNGTVNILCSYTDSFNPYTASSDINRQLCKLIYDPLIKTDNEFKPVNCLAKDATLSGNICTVKLKSAFFSDGSAVTVNDIIHSYNLAISSATAYASQLYEVVSVTDAGDNTVVFTLSRQDEYFLNLLDFPIIKAGSESVTDIDGVLQAPIGCGRYKLSEDNTILLQNENYHGKKGEIKEIKLINSPDADSVSHYVEVGATDLYYAELSDGNIVRMSGKKTDINLNNLVYIGINSYYPALDNKEIRYAISSAIDRTAICQDAYYNNALAATGFFSPVFEDAKAIQSLNNESNIEISVENLDKIGYNNLDNEGYRTNGAGYRAAFTLLVNSENRSRVLAADLIASQLKSVGIKITVVSKPYDQYVADLQSGNFQLYLGEIRVLPNMDFSGLVIPGGSAAYGVKSAEPTEEGATFVTTADIINGYYAGQNSLSDVAGFLLTEMPQIPVCYRKGLLFYSDRFDGDIKASQSDIYFSIESYTYKK